jgi:hypothetical protein
MGLIFNKPQKGSYEFNSLSVTEDADGRMRVWAYAPSGCTKNTPVLINYSQATPFGYMAQLSNLASSTHTQGWCGIPQSTLASGGSGVFQIGGVASQVVWPASASIHAGYAIHMCTSSGLIECAAVATASVAWRDGSATGIVGVALYNATSTNAHDIFLFPLPTRVSLG